MLMKTGQHIKPTGSQQDNQINQPENPAGELSQPFFNMHNEENIDERLATG